MGTSSVTLEVRFNAAGGGAASEGALVDLALDPPTGDGFATHSRQRVRVGDAGFTVLASEGVETVVVRATLVSDSTVETCSGLFLADQAPPIGCP